MFQVPGLYTSCLVLCKTGRRCFFLLKITNWIGVDVFVLPIPAILTGIFPKKRSQNVGRYTIDEYGNDMEYSIVVYNHSNNTSLKNVQKSLKAQFNSKNAPLLGTYYIIMKGYLLWIK